MVSTGRTINMPSMRNEKTEPSAQVARRSPLVMVKSFMMASIGQREETERGG
ncbi:hypothetical protein D3C85_1161590 [compost metagenome]